jgi:microcystin-dependent protein
MHWGNSPGGLNTQIGETLGQQTVTLTVNEIPSHNHGIVAVEAAVVEERSASPTVNSFIANVKGARLYQQAPVTPNVSFSPKVITITGGSQPHDNMQPYLVLNFCIALEGIFPSQN